ncbi:MAG: hypothetical protein WC154_02465 [Candidatus Izemoplasmatales bacterium]
MKKFFSNFLLLISLLIISIVALPFNRITQWGFEVEFLRDNEMLVKAGIGGFALLLSVIFLFVSNHQYKELNSVKHITRNFASLPVFTYAIAIMANTAYLAYTVYKYFISTSAQQLIFFGSLGVILSLFIIGYFLVIEYNRVNNLGRVFRTFIMFEVIAVTAGLAYVNMKYRVGDNYSQIGSRYTILIIPLLLVIFILYQILVSKSSKSDLEIEELEKEVKEIRKNKGISESPSRQDGKKTVIVSKQQTIVSGEGNLDPTEMVFQDVTVDPEFAKTSNQENKPNSIEYYIEKPKMFKPLEPTFDELVSYVRELPQVVTKLDDDRITFYVDRKPFLVLMNYGNYYRMAFKYDLEQGIRLIIKYPTISKNKSTKDELWFKANNYGDIPKEVIYNIVKTAHSNYGN